VKTHRVFHFKVLDRLPGVPGHPLRLEQQLADLPGIDEGTGRVLKDGRGDERPEEVGCIGICSKSEDRLRVLDSCSLLAARWHRRHKGPCIGRVDIQFSQ